MTSRVLPLLPALALVLSCGGKPVPAEPAPAEVVLTTSQQAIAASIEATLDREIDPCVDFYEFACGTWLEETEIPSDRPRWSRGFSTIDETNQGIVRELLESAGGDPRVGAYYQACMDVPGIDARGMTALQPILTEIAAVKDAKGVMAVLAKLATANAFFSGGVDADFKAPDVNVLHLSQGGLGLPQRDYYFPKDDEGTAILADYEAHVGRMLGLAGLDPAGAKGVLAVEKKLAEVSKAPAELRDVEALYHKLDREGLKKLTPKLPWDVFFQAIGAPDLTSINVMTPDFFPTVEALVTGKADWKAIRAYLAWHAVHGVAPHLTSAIDAEHFAFFGTRLEGQKEQQARWKRCAEAADGALGDLLGQAYVDRAFAGESKPKALEMIRAIEAAFEAGLPALTWMDEATRARAIEKLHTIVNKIGYPDKWEPYEGLQIGNDHVANVLASARWQIAKDLAEVGGPVDKARWYMTPPTVNAYYNPLANEIVFPAGIMQPPFFSADFPPSMNFGAMGMVMGHEITHGFDDEGRKFAPDGSMKTWWEDQASERFEVAATCVEELYAGYEVQPGQFINGKLTLGENIADLGGIRLAHRAYMSQAASDPTPPLAGFNGEQLLFLAYAQSWCTKATPEFERTRLQTDSHSPPRFRVNGPLSQLPAFGEAFACEVGEPMRPAEVCEVW
jgi:putative endopeptidase